MTKLNLSRTTSGTEPVPDASPSSSTKKLLVLLAVCYTIFVIYGSLVPLRFVPRPLADAVAAFQQIPFLNLGIDSLADWVANLLLFVPLSFLYTQIATYKATGLSRLVITIAVLGLTVLLSVGIEFTQLFFPQRTVSQNDILAESVGSLIGIVLQCSLGKSLAAWTDNLWRHESTATRVNRALHAYIFIFAIFNVLPLDLTLSPFDLYRKWSEGRILLVPFAILDGSAAKTLYDALSDIAIWLPVGALLSFRKGRSIGQIAILGLSVAFLIELAQIFVFSRFTDTTDIVLGGIGTALGALITRRTSFMLGELDSLPARLWYSAWAAWVMLVLAVFWFPFDFDPGAASLGKVEGVIFRPLLENYYFTSEFHAINELLRKVAFFLPGGILWRLAAHRKTADINKALDKTGALAIFTVAVIVEAGQLCLPQKFADFTDVLLETAGGLLGLGVTNWVLSAKATVADAIGGEQPAPSSPRHSFRMQFMDIADQKSWVSHLLTFVAIFFLVAAVTRIPVIPYNVRELIKPGIFGLFSIIGISAAIQWVISSHFLFIDQCKANPALMTLLPLWLACHGLVTWIFIRLGVPMESIHDIVGSPVLGWHWEWETLGRFLALSGSISLQIVGGILVASLIHRTAGFNLFTAWLCWALFLAWPLYWVIVSQAATDNITELVANNASFLSSALLILGILAIASAGSILSKTIASRTKLLSGALFSLFATIFATLCFWFGAEHFIVKYGKIFSAWQFLLSTNRQSYAVGAELYVRYSAALFMFLCVFALVQFSSWKTVRHTK